MACKNDGGSSSGIMEHQQTADTAALKGRPKMNLSKTDMLELLSHLESELQARDATMAALQAEKAKQFLYQAKYGRFGLVDPLHALQRDSNLAGDKSFDEAAVNAMYDDQLMQLENLIATQHRSQQHMREQLASVDKRYYTTCMDLDEEKLKHALDLDQGDNVTEMLAKDRDRLKDELELERNQVKEVEKKLTDIVNTHKDVQAMSNKHKQVAVMVIKERAVLKQKLVALREHSSALEVALNKEQSLEKSHVTDVSCKTTTEIELERRIQEYDVELQQLRQRLANTEARNHEIYAEINRLRRAAAGSMPAAVAVEIVPAERLRNSDTSVVQRTITPASQPHAYISERTLSPGPVAVNQSRTAIQQASSQPQIKSLHVAPSDLYSAPRISAVDNNPPRRPGDVTAVSPRLSGNTSADRMTRVVETAPQPRSSSLIVDQRPVTSVGGSVPLPMEGGTRVSIGSSSVVRAVAPPIPPNKPQVFIPPPTSRTSNVRGDSTNITIAASKLQSSLSSKVGAMMAKDRMLAAAAAGSGKQTDADKVNGVGGVGRTSSVASPSHGNKSLLGLNKSSTVTSHQQHCTELFLN